MRILAGGPTLGRFPNLAEAWRGCLRDQRVPSTVDIVFHDVIDVEGRHAADYDSKRDDRDRWQDSAMARVGWLRQQFVDHAAEHEYDAVWMVDDDLIPAPDTLAKLLMVDAPIVYGVFWTPGADGTLHQQTWTHHPGSAPMGYIEALRDGHIVDCFGGGACTLIRREAFPVYRWWPMIPGLPASYLWRGEDRQATIRACVHGLRQVAHGGVRIAHLYRDSERTDGHIAEALDAMGWPG